jgi:S-disulfanyl-L-cysteine oxidoreductase SoxD
MDRAELPRCVSCCALLVVALIGSAIEGQEPKRTVWDGVYTAAQAERGQSAYAQACASCHSEDLRGKGTAPSLIEESFLFLWSDMSVGDLLERTRMLMPSDRPGSLPAATYADIIAFIAQKNGFPAGSTDLGADVAALKQILITGKRPPTR